MTGRRGWGALAAAGGGLVAGVLLTLWLGPRRPAPAPGPAAPAPPPVTVAARAVSYHPRHLAYAEVIPVHDVTVASRVVGTVTALTVRVGDPVAAGAPLARIGGPRHRAALSRARAAVDGDEAALAADEKLAAATGHLLSSGLATLTRRAQAQAAVARARSTLAADRATLAALEAGGTLTAPVAGTVVEVHAATGSQVAEGAEVVTLEPAGAAALQLLGRYYGADAAALTPGMTGRFLPADGGAPIPVGLGRLVPPEGPDGAVRVRCHPVGPAPGPGWRSGAAGQLVLEGPPEKAVAVPTAALVLDQGHFFVLVHGPKGDRHQRVRVGPSRGADTLVLGGLAPGDRVVSRDAALRFHQGLARRYAPPD